MTADFENFLFSIASPPKDCVSSIFEMWYRQAYIFVYSRIFAFTCISFSIDLVHFLAYYIVSRINDKIIAEQ